MHLKRQILYVVFIAIVAGCSNAPQSGVIPFEFSKRHGGLRVRIDGEPFELVGARPAISLEVGSHTLEVESEFYEPVNRRFDVVAGRNELLYVELRPKQLSLPSDTIEQDSTLELDKPVDREVATTDVDSESNANGAMVEPPASDSLRLEDKPDSSKQAGKTGSNELTGRELELIQWAQDEKNAHVVRGDGFGLVFFQQSSWTEDEFEHFQDLPNLHTLMFDGWHKGVRVNGPELNDEHVLQLKKLPRLRNFGIQGPGITDRSLEHLASFPLRGLAVFNSSITDDGLVSFSRHSFEYLNLNDNLHIGDRGLLALDLSEIIGLQLSKTGVTNAFMKSLVDSPQIEQLNIANTKVSGRGLSSLQDHSRLIMLIAEDQPIYDKDLLFLKNHENLRQIWLRRTKLTARGLRYIATRFSRLTQLFVGGLEIPSTQVVDWSQLQSLVVLEYTRSHVDNRQLQSIATMKKLKRLTINLDREYLRANQDGFLSFEADLPECRVNGKTIDVLIQDLSR